MNKNQRNLLVVIAAIILLLVSAVPFNVFGLNTPHAGSALEGIVATDKLTKATTGTVNEDKLIAKSTVETDPAIQFETDASPDIPKKIGDVLSLTLTMGQKNAVQTLQKDSVIAVKFNTDGLDFSKMQYSMMTNDFAITADVAHATLVIKALKAVEVAGMQYVITFPVKGANLEVPMAAGVYWSTGNKVDNISLGTLKITNILESSKDASSNESQTGTADQTTDTTDSTTETAKDNNENLDVDQNALDQTGAIDNSLEAAVKENNNTGKYTLSTTQANIVAVDKDHFTQTVVGGRYQISNLAGKVVETFTMKDGFDPSKALSADGTYVIKEIAPAETFKANKNSYYFSYTAKEGITGVTEQNPDLTTEKTPFAATSSLAEPEKGAATDSAEAKIDTTAITTTISEDGLASVSAGKLVLFADALPRLYIKDTDDNSVLTGGTYEIYRGNWSNRVATVHMSGEFATIPELTENLEAQGTLFGIQEVTAPSSHGSLKNSTYVLRVDYDGKFLGISDSGYATTEPGTNFYRNPTDDKVASYTDKNLTLKSKKQPTVALRDNTDKSKVLTGATFNIQNWSTAVVVSGLQVNSAYSVLGIDTSVAQAYHFIETKAPVGYLSLASMRRDFYYDPADGLYGVRDLPSDGTKSRFGSSNRDGTFTRSADMTYMTLYYNPAPGVATYDQQDHTLSVKGGKYVVKGDFANGGKIVSSPVFTDGFLDLATFMGVANSGDIKGSRFSIQETEPAEGYIHNPNVYYFYISSDGISGLSMSPSVMEPGGTSTADGVLSLSDGRLNIYSHKVTDITLDQNVLRVKESELGQAKAKITGQWLDVNAPDKKVAVQVSVDGNEYFEFQAAHDADSNDGTWGSGDFYLDLTADHTQTVDGQKAGLLRSDDTLLGNHTLSFRADGSVMSNAKQMRVLVVPDDYPFDVQLHKYILHGNQKLDVASIAGPKEAADDQPAVAGETVTVGTDLTIPDADGITITNRELTTTIPRELTYKGNLYVTDENNQMVSGAELTHEPTDTEPYLKLKVFNEYKELHIFYDLQAKMNMPAGTLLSGGAEMYDDFTGTSSLEEVPYYGDTSNIARLIPPSDDDFKLNHVPELSFGSHKDINDDDDHYIDDEGNGLYPNLDTAANPSKNYFGISDHRGTASEWQLNGELSSFKAYSKESPDTEIDLNGKMADVSIIFTPQDSTLTPISIIAGDPQKMLTNSNQPIPSNGNELTSPNTWEELFKKVEMRVPNVDENTGTAVYKATMTYTLTDSIS